MRDIELMTKEGLRYEDIHDLIREKFQDYETITDDPKEDEGRIYVRKPEGHEVLDIYFSPGDTMSQNSEWYEEWQLKRFPFDPHLTCVCFRGEETINRFVQALVDFGLEFWVLAESDEILEPKDFLPYHFYMPW